MTHTINPNASYTGTTHTNVGGANTAHSETDTTLSVEVPTADAMRALGGQLRPTGNEGPEMFEQDYDARSQSIEYRVLRTQR